MLVEPYSIQFTFVPPIGSSEKVRGQVSFQNAPCETQAYGVALFIHVPGWAWICKPTEAAPLTAIQPDGSWETMYATGGSDATATELVVFLVTSSYSWPCFADDLPAVDGTTVLASASASR